MADVEFLDASILICAYDRMDRAKQRVAQDLLRQAVSGQMVTSSQMLEEFSATMLQRVSPAMKPSDLAAILDVLSPIKVIGSDGDLVRRALAAHRKYKIPFYDGMIVAAAERGRCGRIWSEELTDGEEYFGVGVRNPFG